MAKAEETLTVGQLVEALGVSQPTWNNHPEWKEWVEKQKGVVFNGNRGSIPASLVEPLKAEFNIQAGVKRGRRKAGTKAFPGYGSFTVAELVEARKKEEALAGDHDLLAEKVKELRKELSALEATYEEAKGATARLKQINDALAGKTSALEAEEARIAEEKALLASLNT